MSSIWQPPLLQSTSQRTGTFTGEETAFLFLNACWSFVTHQNIGGMRSKKQTKKAIKLTISHRRVNKRVLEYQHEIKKKNVFRSKNRKIPKTICNQNTNPCKRLMHSTFSLTTWLN